jgi:serine protease Do
MKNSLPLILGLLFLQAPARAEDDIPLLRPEERATVEAQSDAFNKALAPALAHASLSTVRVWVGTRRLAYGTVVGDGSQVLTKWSEIAGARRQPIIEAAGGEVRPVKVVGVFEEEDLALLEIQGTPLTPVKWSAKVPKLGSFLIAPQPDGQPAAFGVVSVLERNLRDTDQAFLGIISDRDFVGPGVRISEISPETGAQAAGLKPGNIILKLNDRSISGLPELRNSLIGVSPGDTVTLALKTRSGIINADVLLGNRPPLPNYLGNRLEQMQRMGGPISRIRDSFTRVMQTDMRPDPDQIGGPVVDLQGDVVGITMARADRTRSFVMPSVAVEELLASETVSPSQALEVQPDPVAGQRRIRKVPPEPRQQPGGEERMRRHLSEMQRLVEIMREELEMLETEP